jgi:uncharacterized protein
MISVASVSRTRTRGGGPSPAGRTPPRGPDAELPQDSVPRLLDGISQRATSPLNITAASTALGYPSRDIFVRHLNRLVSSHAALWCPRREGEHLVAGARAKLHLTDPLLATLPSPPGSGPACPNPT